MDEREFARERLMGKLVRTSGGVVGIATNVDFVGVMHPGLSNLDRLVIQIQTIDDEEPPPLHRGGWFLDTPIEIWGEGSFDLGSAWAEYQEQLPPSHESSIPPSTPGVNRG